MGSIQKRGENTYFLVVSAGKGLNGKRQRFTKTVEAKSPAQAEKLLIQFQADVDSNNYLKPEKLTFKNFSMDWLRKYGESNLDPETYKHYEEMLNTRIIEAFGELSLSKIKPSHLLDFYENLQEDGMRLDTRYVSKSELQEVLTKKDISIKKLMDLAKISDRTVLNVLKGMPVSMRTAKSISKVLDVKMNSIFNLYGEPKKLSNETIRHHHRLLSAILESAVKWQLIKENVAKRVTPPKASRQNDKNFYDEKQIEILIEKLNSAPDSFKVAVMVTIFTGVRRSELMGLKWPDIDFSNNTINIHQARKYVAGKGIYSKNETKNTSSHRKIGVPGFIINMLKCYKTTQKEMEMRFKGYWKNSDMVFVKVDGEPMHPESVSKWFSKFIKENKLPHLTFHGLRHSFATILIANGIDIVTVSRGMGHSKPSTTWNIYTHFITNRDRIVSDKLEEKIVLPNTFKKYQSS